MSDESIEFQEMLRSLRRGDSNSIVQFVATYEPFIRRTIRHRLSRASLRSVADSVDVCQSVLGSLLIRLAAGQFELHSDEDLRNLVATVAENKFIGLQRRELSQKRDRRMTVSLEDMTEIVDTRQANPEETLSYHDLLASFESRLNHDEKQLYQQRRQGLSWNAIAEGSSHDATVLRQRLSRAIKRVALELRIEDDDGVDDQNDLETPHR